MFAAAVILLIISALLFILGVFGGGKVPLNLGPIDIGASVSIIFLMGMVTLLLFMMSLSLFRHATRRAVGRRRDRKQYEKLNTKLHGRSEVGPDARDEAPDSPGS